MGRRNSRGLELSFKPFQGSRGRGRWFKKIGGTALYLGLGDGVSDRVSYHAALTAYHQWTTDQRHNANARHRTAVTRRLQHGLSPLDHNPDAVDLSTVRQLLERHATLGTDSALTGQFTRAADEAERIQRLAKLKETATLDQLRSLDAPIPKPARTLALVLDEFVKAQRQRMERREKLDTLRAAGQDVHESSRENLSPGRFAEITYNVASFKEVCGSLAWMVRNLSPPGSS